MVGADITTELCAADTILSIFSARKNYGNFFIAFLNARECIFKKVQQALCWCCWCFCCCCWCWCCYWCWCCWCCCWWTGPLFYLSQSISVQFCIHLLTAHYPDYSSCCFDIYFCWHRDCFFKNGLYLAFFSLFLSFQYTVDRKKMFNININFCRWLDLNRGPLVLEATTLPTEPQPLPQQRDCFFNLKMTNLEPTSKTNFRVE